MTIFVDFAGGRIIHAVEGTAKGKTSSISQKTQKQAKSLKAIAMDIIRSFFWAENDILPEVALAFK